MSWQIGPKLLLGRGGADTQGFVHARHATAADIKAVLEIEQAAHPTAWPRKIFEGELALECSSFWVFEQPIGSDAALERIIGDEELAATERIPTEIVGFLVYWLVHDEVHILNIAVAPRARRRGIATAIMSAVIAQAIENLASFVTLEVRITNKAAIGLYEALGFVIIGQRPHYYADTGEDALIMSRLF